MACCCRKKNRKRGRKMFIVRKKKKCNIEYLGQGGDGDGGRFWQQPFGLCIIAIINWILLNEKLCKKLILVFVCFFNCCCFYNVNKVFPAIMTIFLPSSISGVWIEESRVALYMFCHLEILKTER